MRPHTALASASLVIAGLACTIGLGGPHPPEDLSGASPEAAEELESLWESLQLLDVDSGDVTFVLTEEQLTSFLAHRIDEAEDPILQQPAVVVRDGEFQVYGVASAGSFEARTALRIQPTIDSDGTLSFSVTAAELGPLPVSEAIREGLSGLLTEAFTGKLGPMASGIRITSLVVADGQVEIVGSLR